MAVLKAWFTVSLPSINDVDTVFWKMDGSYLGKYGILYKLGYSKSEDDKNMEGIDWAVPSSQFSDSI